MFRSLPSRIQLTDKEVLHTLQEVYIDRAILRRLDSIARMNDMAPSQHGLLHREESLPSSLSLSSDLLLSDRDRRDANCLLASSSRENSPFCPDDADHDESLSYQMRIPARLLRSRRNLSRGGGQRYRQELTFLTGSYNTPTPASKPFSLLI
ncbi:hypothetical protein BGW36DRAFT_361205 [Talaromyces proteolyticus]|uniref:Uncharacterized protein n=1 Tax=Talaromyces proteolyticus TaxID=1131652 RepID=A0AAD4KLS1_9EURO|nr:uncharacterized protein BGW36DRAFT_361205 [Talaromyces proteolyticus]KAH8695509.1 hypothetical protein BGW36DRAFT_361205 [Talaromyces proteolyticus]